MKIYNVLLLGLAVVGLVFGASCDEIPSGGYSKPDDCRVDSFVKTQWGQTTANGRSDGPRCFNYYVTNQVEAVKDYVGCFPVAVAQAMRYWRCTCTNGPVSVDCVVSDGSTVVTNGLTTFGGGYDWDNMPEATVSLAEGDVVLREAIGRLMHDLAVASASTFTPDHTVANPLDVYKCLTERVGGFANAEIAIFNDGNCPYSVAGLERLVVPNLDAGAPVIFALAYENAAITHAAVIDGYGYRDGRLMLHANFGAWGSGDGWYYADEGFCVGGKVYPSVSLCLYNLFPGKRGSAVSGRVLDVSRRTVAGSRVKAFSNETCVAECTTGGNGVYAFVLAPGEYVVKADKDGFAAELPPFKVGVTESRQISDAEATAAGNYRSEPEYAPLIGNSFGHDLLLPGHYSDQATAPTVSPADGAKIFCATNVTLACATPGAVIRYTLDGSEPTLQSTRYTEPFEVLGDRVTVKAIAFARNMNPSEVTTATFTYENADKLLGDDRDAPMMLTGTNVTRKVSEYCRYERKDGDPIVDQDCFDKFGPAYLTESHAAWFSWKAPGSGVVSITASVKGPSETGYYYGLDGRMSEDEESRPPKYGVSMVTYEGCVSNVSVNGRSETSYEAWSEYDDDGNWTDGWALVYHEEATNTFEVVQGMTYFIQCVCPYHLEEDYLDPEWYYCIGPSLYRWSDELGCWMAYPFKSQEAYLELTLTADLTVEPPPAARMTVPQLQHTTVRVLADGVEAPLTNGSLQLSPNVNYAITYTALDGYAFEDGKATWSAIVRDDTGADFSVADLEGFPADGPRPVQWNRPTTDEGVHAALAASGFGGAVLQKVTTLMAFDAFVGYLGDATGAASPDQLSEGQKANAYLCYRLGAGAIPRDTLEPEDVTIATSTVQADGSLALELKIAGVTPGATVSPEVIKELVSAEGGDDLSNLNAENVALSGVGIADGKVRVNVKPNATHMGERPSKFFSRLRLLP